MTNHHKLTFFNSQEEKEEIDLIRIRNLSHEERMIELRQCINLAYGMHGYDPLNLPKNIHLLLFLLHSLKKIVNEYFYISISDLNH